MKLIPVFIAATVLLFSACSDSNNESSSGFELKGKLGNAHGDTLYLEQMATDGLKKVDTAILDENGEFAMHTIIPEIGFYRLKTNDRNFATLIFEPNQKVTITGDVADLGN
jgi:hypothetical protein